MHKVFHGQNVHVSAHEECLPLLPLLSVYNRLHPFV